MMNDLSRQILSTNKSISTPIAKFCRLTSRFCKILSIKTFFYLALSRFPRDFFERFPRFPQDFCEKHDTMELQSEKSLGTLFGLCRKSKQASYERAICKNPDLHFEWSGEKSADLPGKTPATLDNLGHTDRHRNIWSGIGSHRIYPVQPQHLMAVAFDSRLPAELVWRFLGRHPCTGKTHAAPDIRILPRSLCGWCHYSNDLHRCWTLAGNEPRHCHDSARTLPSSVNFGIYQRSSERRIQTDFCQNGTYRTAPVHNHSQYIIHVYRTDQKLRHTHIHLRPNTHPRFFRPYRNLHHNRIGSNIHP